jgi:hypothetical protein
LRRIISILLLALLVYNMMGYSLAYLLEERNDVRDTNYIEHHPFSKDIVIKLPVNIPYQTNWAQPEPVDGKIEHNGEFYQMVSRQLINDTMYVHCEYDQNARDRFMDLVSNINEQITGEAANPSKGAPSMIMKSFLKEYLTIRKQYTFYLIEWSDHFVLYPPVHVTWMDSSLAIPAPPPDLA